MLSRLPLPSFPPNTPTPGKNLLAISMLESLPVTAKDVKHWTSGNPVLSRVRLMVSSGWKDTSDDDLKPYQQQKNELSLHDGCVL